MSRAPFTSSILAKVIEYCEKHVDTDDKDSKAVDDSLKLWDAEFVTVEQHLLFDIILAANYLNIKSLHDLTCQTVADMIKGKTPEELQKIFNLNKDVPNNDVSSGWRTWAMKVCESLLGCFSVEEEEVRRENELAFE